MDIEQVLLDKKERRWRNVRQASPMWRSVDAFSAPLVRNGAQGIGDDGRQRLTMKALLGSPLEVIKPHFFLQSLIRPKAVCPAREMASQVVTDPSLRRSL
jgi:hypothetical protein